MGKHFKSATAYCLRNYRKCKKLSQEKLAEALSLSAREIANLECEKHAPDLRHFLLFLDLCEDSHIVDVVRELALIVRKEEADD